MFVLGSAKKEMVEIVHINIRNKKFFQNHGEYIGRPTILGNPFLTKYQPREDVLRRYKTWLNIYLEKEDDNKVIKELDRLFSILIKEQSLTLLCWCAPKACHGDIIKEVLLKKYHTGKYI